ncbi:MAG TPA: insulinase family protein, partial [Fimbriiglobus sp.]|nr:insulinase family protein [Fimbriiglobus sp.]
RVVRASERPMGRMRAVATSWLYNGEYCDVDREMARFDAVTTGAIREYLNRYPINEATVVGYGPLVKL